MDQATQVQQRQALRSKQFNIVMMIMLAVFLVFMDLKDLLYKVIMCGPFWTWSFTADIHEDFTGIDLTKVLRENNNVRTTSHNQWNALAQQCDSLELYKLVGKTAHLSARGTGCVLGGVKRNESLVFIGSVRIDALLWGASTLSKTIHSPIANRPFQVVSYSIVYDLPEVAYVEELETMIRRDEVAAVNKTATDMFGVFGSRLDLWETTLCYEILPEPPRGEQTATHLVPGEYGCIWSNSEGEELHEFHTDNAGAKYLRVISEWVGLNWNTVDYMYISMVYQRARLRMVSTYSIDNIDKKMVHHWIKADLGVDGVLYYVMLGVEVAMFIISASDSLVVAWAIVRPLILSSKRGQSYQSSQTVRTSNEDQIEVQQRVETSKRNETLSRVLLFADLTCVSFRKRTLSALIVFDAFFSWIYVIPNSTVFAWSTSPFQLTSAYLANFRIWAVVVVFVDKLWLVTFVWTNEKLAALITELTYIRGVEVMFASLLGIFVEFDDLLNVCLLKWGTTDRQREMFPTVPGLLSFYNSYNKYSYGDRSRQVAGMMVLYKPLIKMLGYSVLFSIIIILLRLAVTVAIKAKKGTLVSEVSLFWRTYQRNSAEVFMNDPLRAKALVRSQRVMSYRFGRSVFIRPFVYLEQNYYIYRGRFRRRPLVPLIDESDSIQGTKVNTDSYELDSVVYDTRTNKRQKILSSRIDTQIPLC